MSPPHRRSSRLRGRNSTVRKAEAPSSHRLSSLKERDETPFEDAVSQVDPTDFSPAVPHTPASATRIKPSIQEMHPGKTHSSSSPAFDFRPLPALGPEAQHIMDELREETLRIKVRLAAEREEEHRNRHLDDSYGAVGRKIATPKGKVGRFSDVHIAEFKKMDSIAGHASSFRAQPSRYVPAATSLKRSQSKAKLDSREDFCQGKTASKKRDALEDPPTKRARVLEKQYSSHLPISEPTTPTLSRSRSVLSSITTPTQASIARAASIKQPSQIPTVSHSPSKHISTTPRLLKKSITMSSISNGKIPDPVPNPVCNPSKLDRIKSILRRPMASPQKSVSTKVPSVQLTSDKIKPNLDKALPPVPSTPITGRSRSIKRVNFTPETIAKVAATYQNSPSPLKSGFHRSKSSMTLGTIHYPTLNSLIGDECSSEKVTYPALNLFDPEQSESISQVKTTLLPPSVPGTFSFRSDKTINFGASPRGFGSSPGQASVRQVRPSIFPSTMGSTFPESNKENVGGLPAIPHGFANKKRQRAGSDGEEDEANLERSPAKKRKGPAETSVSLMERKLQAEKNACQSKIPSPSKKRILSLSRLNMLARPKLRK